MSFLPTWLATSALLVSAGLALPSPPVSRPLYRMRQPCLREVEAQQKQLDKVRENYTFRAVKTTRQLDSKGNTKKIETEEHEVFFVNGHRVQKLVRKDGKDLTPDQARKEQDRVNKEVLKISQPGYPILIRTKSPWRGCSRLSLFPSRGGCG